MVRTGYAHALVDQPEGPWLDGKQSVVLATDKQRLEFAKDVAAFANSPDGGLIVIGAAAVGTANGDVIRSVRDVPLGTVNVPQMRSIIRERVFPTIDGLDIRAIDHGGPRGVVMVHVPPQPESRTPFLVKGLLVDGKVKSTYMALPVRDGEDTKWSDMSTIHALLQAGRLANALLADSVDELRRRRADQQR